MKVVCLCSGLGKRCRPLTDKVPKSLIPIEKYDNQSVILNACNVVLDSNLPISEIIFVAQDWYFKNPLFHAVEGKLASNVPVTKVTTHYNPEKYNNWSSMYSVLESIDNLGDEGLLVLEGDILIDKEFTKVLNTLKQNVSTCFCTYRSNEWVVISSRRHQYEVSKNSTGLALNGVSYVAPCDIGGVFKGLYKIACEEYFMRYGRINEFWDETFIDSVINLDIIDSTGYLDEFDSIVELVHGGWCTPLKVAQLVSDDNQAIEMDSMTNQNFKITYQGVPSIIRIPSPKTDEYIHRDKEEIVVTKLQTFKNEVTPYTEWYPGGVKLSKFIDNTRVSNPSDVKEVMRLLSVVHNKEVSSSDISYLLTNLITEIRDYEKLYKDKYIPDNYKEVSEFYQKYITDNQHKEVALCHRDLDLRNILVDKDSGKGLLVDFEYSGILNHYWDLGCYISEVRLAYPGDCDYVDFVHSLDFYEAYTKYERDTLSKVDLNKVEVWSGIVDYVWACWSIARCSCGSPYEDYLKERWNTACEIMNNFKDHIDMI